MRVPTDAADSRGKAAKAGTLRLRLRCTSIGTARCKGTLALRSRLRGHERTSTIAGASNDIARGTWTFRMQLSLPARRVTILRAA